MNTSDIKALEKAGDVKGLIAELKDPRNKDHALVALVLGNLGDAQAVKPLIETLQKDKDWPARRFAAGALGKIGDARAIKALINALKDKEESVREESALALGKFGCAEAVAPFVRAMEAMDKDPGLAAVAYEALQKFTDPKAVKPLLAALCSQRYMARRSAFTALGRIRDPRTVEPLISLLKDPEVGTRAAAAETLGQIGDSQAIGPLISALADFDSSVTYTAAEALGKLCDSTSVVLLKAHMNHRHEATREAIGKAIKLKLPRS